ncbi:MAG: POTRA domain-containing protein [Candidatus Poribacteria bacterium]
MPSLVFARTDIIRSIIIDQNSVFSKGKIKSLMKSKVGGEYDPNQLEIDLGNIVSFYKKHGYSYARIQSWEPKFFSDEVYLWITIDEGKIGHISVRGNQRTKERIILQELLFKPGDIYNEEDRLESERILRKKPYFGKAEITTNYNDIMERVDVTVEVSDLWTFFPAISLPSFSGGDSDMIVAISDYNILGFGQSGRLRYKQKREDGNVQHLFTAAYTEPRLFTTHLQFSGRYIYKKEGNSWEVSFLRPLYSLKEKWATEISVADSIDIEKWYENGQVTDESERTSRYRFASITRVFGDRKEQNQISFWYKHDKRNFKLLKNFPPSKARFENHKESMLGTTIQNGKIHFITETFLDKMGRVEDVALGYNYGISLGYSSTLWDADTNETYLALEMANSQKRGRRTFINASSQLSNYIAHSFFHDFVFEGKIRCLVKDFWRQTLAMQLSWWLGHRLDGRRQFLLGGQNGLRGYKARKFNGTREILLNLESRFIFHKSPFVVMGGAVFADIGYIWEGNILDIWDYKRSIGAGLRIAFPRLNDSPVYRLDFGYALDSDEPFSFANAFSVGIGHEF